MGDNGQRSPEWLAGHEAGFQAGLRAAKEWVPDNVAAQPVSQVRWLDRQLLDGNDYNPNIVAPPERRLLVTSILEDGWTQPIVVRPEGDRFEVVDGFHRWSTSGVREVYDLTDGLVPTVQVPLRDAAHQRMSTIRHNRARGVHHVTRMADIVADLVDEGLTEDELCARLGMDQAEVRRLLERGNMTARANTGQLGEAWRPAPRT
jgi:ParB-like chromosome segregation protein Spo0J